MLQWDLCSDNSKQVTNLAEDGPEEVGIEITTPEEAEEILRPVVHRLVDEGWRLIGKPLYGARLVRGKETLDLRVDLLGNLERETRIDVWSGAETGRLVAWVLLITSLLFALALASALGLLD